MALKVYTCADAAIGPTTIFNIFFKVIQGNEHTAA
jgi:hypothetical protein